MNEVVLPPPRARVVDRRARLGFELAIVFVVACLLLVPGIWRYSLVDPWESHYGEVARRMLQGNDTPTGHWQDWVHTDWQNEGFRSKPVLTFWLMATSMRAMGLGEDGGYSGEMAESRLMLFALRLPFVLLAVLGLVLMWWMLARLVSRRAAWLAFLTVGTTPFFFFIARQGITDMTLVGLMMGAFSVFLLASEDGDEPIRPLWHLSLGRGRSLAIDGRWAFVAIIGGFIAVQAVYYFVYFQVARYAPRVGRLPQPGWWFLILMTWGLLYVLAPRALTYAKAGLYYPWVAALGHPRPWARALELGAISWFAFPLAVVLLPWVAIFSDRPVWDHAFALARRLTNLAPLVRTGQVYMLWFWAFVGISILGKGLPGFGLAGVCCAAYVLFQWKWRALYDGAFEIKRGIMLLLLTVLPWHIAMWMRDGVKFIQEWVFTHNLNRAAVGVHGDRGTFDYCLGQLGYGMFLWAGLVPMALAAAALVPSVSLRTQRVRFLIGLWAIAATALFSLSQTKFHHYIFPAIPALAILIALWLDDLLAGRVKPSLVVGAFGAAVVLLLARDMMHEEKQWIEMFIYRYDRPWPSSAPWSIDTSDAFLVMGLVGAAAVFLIGTRLRRLAVIVLAVAALGSAMWAMHVYMPIAGTHWGMRDAVRRYYQDRQIYGERLVYYTPRAFHDDWARGPTHWDFDTFIPDAFQDGQPMTVSIEVQGVPTELRFAVRGTARVVGDHTIRIELAPDEVAKVREVARKYGQARPGRRTLRLVDADRLIAWQLYWRGENFWSGDEIWGPLPELKTAFKEADNVAMNRYLNDRSLAREGRRIFVVTEGGRIGSLRGILPTQTARETFQVLDTTGNKFSMAAFQM